MRIRRNASKLLGSTTLYAIPPPPTPAAAACCSASASASASAAADDEISSNVCELNCSPWDLMLLNLDDYFLTNRNEEEGKEGNYGNSIKTEHQEEQKLISTSVTTSCTSAELTSIEAAANQISEKDTIQKERRKKKAYKGKEKDTIASTSVDNSDSISYCKKSDGKRWHCKRTAQLPHSFCSYHTAQVKSYSSTTNHPASSASKLEAIDEMTSGTDNYNQGSSSLYYYYEGFGPWRGKRRGNVVARGSVNNSTCNGSAEIVEEEEKDGDKNSCEIKMDHGGCDGNAVAGDDEHDDLDCSDNEEDDDDVKNKDNCGMKQDSEVKKGLLGKLEKKRPAAAVIKKRGRKPFKCRSLKSLL